MRDTVVMAGPSIAKKRSDTQQKERHRLPVTIDIGPAVHQGAGLARYAERLSTYLLCEQSHQLDLTFFYNTHSDSARPPGGLQGAKQQSVAQGQLSWRLGALFSQLLKLQKYERLIRGGVANRTNLPLYHATEHLLPRLRLPTVLTVHDLIFERFPQHHTLRNRLFLRTAMPIFVRNANHIIAVSEHTRQDLLELYGAPAEKIRVIAEGIDPEFAPAAAASVAKVREQYSPQRPYLLMVGTLDPRKNHLAAMKALARLKAHGFPHKLVVAGGKGWLFEPIQEQVSALGLTDDVTFAGYVPGEELPALYSGADCVLNPSVYEGFGFSVLEAMACGVPVVSSNASSLPEVAGDAALLVDPHDVDGLAAAIENIVASEALSVSLRSAGLARAAQFSWSKCAAETAELYHETAQKFRYNVVQMRERGTLEGGVPEKSLSRYL